MWPLLPSLVLGAVVPRHEGVKDLFYAVTYREAWPEFLGDAVLHLGGEVVAAGPDAPAVDLVQGLINVAIDSPAPRLVVQILHCRPLPLACSDGEV